MDAAGRGSRRPVATLVLAVIALVGVVRLPSLRHQLYDPDEAAIAAQAISIRDGGTLYVDAIDRKPPLPPFLYAASFRLTGSTDLRPLHALAALALAGAAVLLALDARRRHGAAAGWWAAVLAVAGAVAFFPVDGQSANYAHFALLPGAGAVVLARRGRTTTALLGGVLLGLAVLCRQSWLIGIVPGALGAALASGRRDLAGRESTAHPWRDALAFVVGTVAVIAAVGLVLPFADFWRWTFTNNSGFVTAGVAVGPTLGRLAATVGTFVAFHLALVALVAVAGRRRLAARAEWRSDIDLWLWVASGLVAVVAGFRFFGHYWLQVLPPAVVLGAPLAARLGRRLRPWAAAAAAV
ncbi:MAG: hypothetical protein JWN46_3725, partial [Acidimicrobiales bacterium]|nr:hypothetical protein [Acidimicrobiales bacterium]